MPSIAFEAAGRIIQPLPQNPEISGVQIEDPLGDESTQIKICFENLEDRDPTKPNPLAKLSWMLHNLLVNQGIKVEAVCGIHPGGRIFSKPLARSFTVPEFKFFPKTRYFQKLPGSLRLKPDFIPTNTIIIDPIAITGNGLIRAADCLKKIYPNANPVLTSIVSYDTPILRRILQERGLTHLYLTTLEDISTHPLLKRINPQQSEHTHLWAVSFENPSQTSL